MSDIVQWLCDLALHSSFHRQNATWVSCGPATPGDLQYTHLSAFPPGSQGAAVKTRLDSSRYRRDTGAGPGMPQEQRPLAWRIRPLCDAGATAAVHAVEAAFAPDAPVDTQHRPA
jgi:hypothetical protein